MIFEMEEWVVASSLEEADEVDGVPLFSQPANRNIKARLAAKTCSRFFIRLASFSQSPNWAFSWLDIWISRFPLRQRSASISSFSTCGVRSVTV